MALMFGKPADVNAKGCSQEREHPFSCGLALSVYLIVAVNDRHASAVKVSTGPLRSVVSRTSTASAEATSTHSPPLSPE